MQNIFLMLMQGWLAVAAVAVTGALIGQTVYESYRFIKYLWVRRYITYHYRSVKYQDKCTFCYGEGFSYIRDPKCGSYEAKNCVHCGGLGTKDYYESEVSHVDIDWNGLRADPRVSQEAIDYALSFEKYYNED